MTRAVTLVELIITIAIAAIPAALLLTQTMGASVQSRNTMAALSLARAELERLDALNAFFNTVLNVTCATPTSVGTPLTTTMPNYGGSPYDVIRIVSCQTGNCCNVATNSQGVKRIVVTVRRNGTTATVCRLITYRTKHVNLGG